MGFQVKPPQVFARRDCLLEVPGGVLGQLQQKIQGTGVLRPRLVELPKSAVVITPNGVQTPGGKDGIRPLQLRERGLQEASCLLRVAAAN